jgi:hypothetical protein
MSRRHPEEREWPTEWAAYDPGRFACRADFHYQRGAVARRYGFSPMPDIEALATLHKEGPLNCPPQGCRLCKRSWMGNTE